MKKNPPPIPLALFDSLEYINSQIAPSCLLQKQKNDFLIGVRFLKSYTGSVGTFNSYRREIERLLQWIFLIEKKNTKRFEAR